MLITRLRLISAEMVRRQALFPVDSKFQQLLHIFRSSAQLWPWWRAIKRCSLWSQKEVSGQGYLCRSGTKLISLEPAVYFKFRHLPIQLLTFVDRKVDTSVNRVQDCLPSSLKSASFKAYKHARSAPVAARSVMIDVKNTGMVETASGLAKTVFSKYEPVAKDFYTKYEPVTEEYLLYVWRVLNQYLLFQRAAQAAAPIAGYCSEMYNQKVELAAKSGYKVASHLPLIPIERIAEALRNENMQPMVVDGGHGEEVAA